MLVALRRNTASSTASKRGSLVTNLGLKDHLDYVVYGIVEVASRSTFAVRDQSFAWLMSVPSELFEVVDPQHSDTWVTTRAGDRTLTGPRELCHEPGFLEHLADGNSDTQRIFAGWRAEYADYSEAEGRALVGRLLPRLRTGEASALDLTFEDLGFAYARKWLDPSQGVEISAYMYGEDSDERVGDLMSIEIADDRRAVEILESSLPPLHSASAHRRAWVRAFSSVAPPGGPTDL